MSIKLQFLRKQLQLKRTLQKIRPFCVFSVKYLLSHFTLYFLLVQNKFISSVPYKDELVIVLFHNNEMKIHPLEKCSIVVRNKMILQTDVLHM